MIEITYGVNIDDDIERQALESLKTEIAKKLNGIGPSPTGERLSVNVAGRKLKDLTFEISGPEDLVEKAKKLFA